MHKRLYSGAVLAALASFVLLPASGLAATAADFYKGKTVKIVFGFGAGGTYYGYSHLLADFLPKHIPGNPKVITQSMPGAGGLKAAAYAYNAMSKDGTGLYMPVDSLIVSQLLEPKSAKYKADGFTWLGNLIQSNAVVVVRADSGVNSIDDAKSKQIIMASTGKGSQTWLVPQLLNTLYGTKFKIVIGYQGSAESQLAMERGEAHGISLTWEAWNTNRPQWFKPGGFARPVVQIGFQKERDLPDVPMLSDLVGSEGDKQIVDFIATLSPLGRGLAVPPGVPAERVALLRAAFAKVVADPAFQAEAAKRKLRLDPLSGEEVQKIVAASLAMSPDVVKRARALMTGPSE